MREEIVNARCLDWMSETARLRHSPRFEDVRQLIGSRGFDPQRILLFFCEHAGGPDMLIRLALPDATIVEAVMRKDVTTKRYTSIVEWKTVSVGAADEEDHLAQHIVTSDDVAGAFSRAAERYYDFWRLCGVQQRCEVGSAPG